LAAVLAFLPFLATGQGTFQNLNFEAATVPASQPPSVYIDPSTWVSVSAALPGWSAVLGTNELATVLYNSLTLGSTAVSLLRTNNGIHQMIDGTFTAFLTAGPTDVGSNTLARYDASLSQVGLVPINAQSLRFKAIHVTPWEQFAVSLGGQTLNLVPLDVTPSYTLYGANMSTFANQTAELRFTAFIGDGGGNRLGLDSILFSPEPVPEPTLTALLVAGAAIVLGSRRRNAGWS